MHRNNRKRSLTSLTAQGTGLVVLAVFSLGVAQAQNPAEGGGSDASDTVFGDLRGVSGLDVFVGGCPNVCTPNEMIIGCDDRYPKSVNVDGSAKAPWRFTGRFDGDMHCTGTLIGDRFVLTSAHCMSGLSSPPRLTFSLAQEAEDQCQRPYGSYAVKRIWIPEGFRETGQERHRALDYAVVELWRPIAGATPANWGQLNWSVLKNKRPRSVGYPSPNLTLPPLWAFWGAPWATGAQEFHTEQPYRRLDGGESGLLYTTLDGTGGQSGAPVYVFHEGLRLVIGVLVGSPEDACQANQNWVARLTSGAVEHIDNVVGPGTFDSFWDYIEVPHAADIPPCGGGGAGASFPATGPAPTPGGSGGGAEGSRAAILGVSPNPVRASASIRLATQGLSSKATLSIHNASGQRIKTYRTSDNATPVWDLRTDAGERVPAGAYFLRLTDTGGVVDRGQLLVIR